MKHLFLLGAACVGLLLVSRAQCAANQVNDQRGFIVRVQDCCNCPPTASDQQCFMECNAMLPRCRPAAARAPVRNSRGPLGNTCCYSNRKPAMNGVAPIRSACKMQYFDHVERQTRWVTGKVWPAI